MWRRGERDAELAELLLNLRDLKVGGLRRRGGFRLGHLGVHFSHTVGDDADEEVQHDHRAEQDEADEIERGQKGCGTLRSGEDIRPIVEGDHLEQ